MKPTEEQQQAVSLACSNLPLLKIEALAGTGKTSTLKLCADALSPKKGLYLAFNKAIKDEADSKFGSSVNCKTAHGMAYGVTGKNYRDRLRGRLTPKVAAQALSLAPYDKYSTNAIATLVMETFTNFCNSSDEKLNQKHLPKSINPKIAEYVTEYSKILWLKIDDITSSLPVTHDFYLKKYQLKQPKIYADYIMFDEAQDANACMLDIVMRQDCPKIFVGDRYQQIYSWRGAVNAMQAIQGEEIYLTKSFRFGPSLADEASAILRSKLGFKQSVQGFEQLNTSVEFNEYMYDPDAILYRTNSAMLREIMNSARSFYLVGGVFELMRLIDAAQEMKAGARVIEPELAAFENWDEVVSFSESTIGQDLKTLVKLVNDNESQRVKNKLYENKDQTEQTADVVLTTAHKAKGREWNNVMLSSDFVRPIKMANTIIHEGEEICLYQPIHKTQSREDNANPEEYNLLYVAVTRAQQEINLSNVKELFFNGD